jgi:hypothetical protein
VEAVYHLALKIFEGYSYSKDILLNLYILLCNLATQEAFLEKISKVKVYNYALIHLLNNWRSAELSAIIFRFLKYTLRTGLMVEQFLEGYAELVEQTDLNLVAMVIQVRNEHPQNNVLLVEMLTVLSIAARNNRKFESGLINDQQFIVFIRKLAAEDLGELTEEFIDILSNMPIEDFLFN